LGVGGLQHPQNRGAKVEKKFWIWQIIIKNVSKKEIEWRKIKLNPNLMHSTF